MISVSNSRASYTGTACLTGCGVGGSGQSAAGQRVSPERLLSERCAAVRPSRLRQRLYQRRPQLPGVPGCRHRTHSGLSRAEQRRAGRSMLPLRPPGGTVGTCPVDSRTRPPSQCPPSHSRTTFSRTSHRCRVRWAP